MDITDIRKYLPHRYPFLLVDRVVEVNPGQSIIAYKNLTVNEPFFDGHFPEKPIFPGVLLLEAMAQAAGILGFCSQGKTNEEGSMYYFAGADDVRFKRPCVPGDRVMLRASVVSQRRGIWKFDVSSDVDGELAASATILCADR
ncbi:MAG: 3-hydroxyacyl-ACP dehydratase FabZ [Halioglobus sp.]|nr:3-hydroxyacyl-ACP dehydratase FabZ [Halioglobus sp.]